MSALNSAYAVTDFDQYSRLRASAKTQDPEALRATAKQFEALFTQQLLKSMRAATPGDDLFGGEQSEFYRDLYDQQLAVHLSAGKGLGIADLMLRQLQQSQAPSPVAERKTASGISTLPLPSAESAAPISSGTVARDASADPAMSMANASTVQTPRYGVATVAYADESTSTPLPLPLAVAAQAPAAPVRDTLPRRVTREQFVDKLLPHAERAASELGVSPHALIAQAALETGWGRHVIRNSDGSSSLNFFAIKADKGWQGDRTRTSTTEYVNGHQTKAAAQFRAYDSIGEAFDDYARFIKANPRYRAALAHGGSDARYMLGLQRAGYASDPNYAAKIHRVAASDLIRGAVATRVASL